MGSRQPEATPLGEGEKVRIYAKAHSLLSCQSLWGSPLPKPNRDSKSCVATGQPPMEEAQRKGLCPAGLSLTIYKSTVNSRLFYLPHQPLLPPHPFFFFPIQNKEDLTSAK